DYVSDLLRQFETNPSSVDQEWREYFRVLARASVAEPSRTPSAPQPEYDWSQQPADTQPAKPSPTAPATISTPGAVIPKHVRAEGERLSVRGAALRLAENMQASLSVPTATSQRQIPLKLLDENRRLVNKHLEATGRKVSYTHLIARALIKALETFPQ